MSEPAYTIYDFRQAGAADDSANAFRTWIAKSAQAFSDLWARISGTDVSLATSDIRTQSFDSAFEDIPLSNLCCSLNLANVETACIWHISQDDTHKLIADLLGMSTSAETPDRQTTEMEHVLVKTFFDALAKAIAQGWLGKQPISCEVQSMSLNPKRIRLCRGKDLVIASSLQVQLSRGEVTVHWISKKQEMTDLLKLVMDRRGPTTRQSDPQAVIELLPIEIVGLLGQADIPMRRLASIQVGDIVQLNQRIDQPIIAAIDGRPFFECWPGKVGQTAGLEVSTCLNTVTTLNDKPNLIDPTATAK